jgi:hypothetical protein
MCRMYASAPITGVHSNARVIEVRLALEAG